MSVDVRSYRAKRRRTKDGRIRWALEASCVYCPRPCNHWSLLPWRWRTQSEAEQQAIEWQDRQRTLLAAWRRDRRSTPNQRTPMHMKGARRRT